MPPAGEVSPAPEEGERVVFRSHFIRGFGLLASGFLRSFLEFYHLQPHHITPSTVMLLSAFVTMCEGHLGILPTIELWGALFYTKLGTSAKEKAAQCGAFVAVHRPSVKNVFPAIKLSVGETVAEIIFLRGERRPGNRLHQLAALLSRPSG